MKRRFRLQERMVRLSLLGMLLLVMAVAGLRSLATPTPVAAERHTLPMAVTHSGRPLDTATDQASCESDLSAAGWDGPYRDPKAEASRPSDSSATSICKALIAYWPKSKAKNLDEIAQWAVQQSNSYSDWKGLVRAARQQFPLKDCPTSGTFSGPFNAFTDARVSDSCTLLSQLWLAANASQYTIGSGIVVCYGVPGPGQVTLTDTQGSASSQLLSGTDDGTGDCLGGRVTGPAGQECMRLDYSGLGGNNSPPPACWTVTNAPTTASQPPSGGGSSSCSWSGRWQGTDADLNLTQTTVSGVITVTGTWGTGSTDPKGFQGTVSGNVLTGTWYNGTRGGSLSYTMGADCTFSGDRWDCYKGTPPAGQGGSPQCSTGTFAPLHSTYHRVGGSTANGPTTGNTASASSPSSSSSSGGGSSSAPLTSGSGSSTTTTPPPTSGSSSGNNCFDLFGIQVCVSP